tara:strand:- start:751 stop:1104 length:354 start_codon:yes stop_codon:yes gene_type:complete
MKVDKIDKWQQQIQLATSTWLDAERWGEFQSHRKSIDRGKKMTPYAEWLIIRKLLRFKEEGYDPNELIDIAIERGWKSIFVPQDMKRGNNKKGWRGLDNDEQMQIAMKDLEKGHYVN